MERRKEESGGEKRKRVGVKGRREKRKGGKIELEEKRERKERTKRKESLSGIASCVTREN